MKSFARPREVDAVQIAFDPSRDTWYITESPTWFMEAMRNGFINLPSDGSVAYVYDGERDIPLVNGDYIVKEDDGFIQVFGREQFNRKYSLFKERWEEEVKWQRLPTIKKIMYFLMGKRGE